MKRCPSCNERFTDEYLFCLNDGTPLVAMGVSLEYGGETPTVVVPKAHPPSERRKIPVYMWLFPVTGLLLGLLVVLGFVMFGLIRSSGSGNTVAVTNVKETPSPSVTSTPFITPQPSASVSSTPRLSETTTLHPKPIDAPPPVIRSYPATTRLRFARGAVSTSFTGDLNPNDSRSLVLACRSGQSLTASITSGGGCVTFRSGGTLLRSVTNRGDNFLTLTNNCSSPSRFSVNVTIV